jgi:hypothetical protein
MNWDNISDDKKKLIVIALKKAIRISKIKSIFNVR